MKRQVLLSALALIPLNSLFASTYSSTTGAGQPQQYTQYQPGQHQQQQYQPSQQQQQPQQHPQEQYQNYAPPPQYYPYPVYPGGYLPPGPPFPDDNAEDRIYRENQHRPPY